MGRWRSLACIITAVVSLTVGVATTATAATSSGRGTQSTSNVFYGFKCEGWWHRTTPCIDMEGEDNYLQVVAGGVECMLFQSVTAYWVISSSKHSFPTYRTSKYTCHSSFGPAETQSAYHYFDRSIATYQNICAKMYSYEGGGRWRAWTAICWYVGGPLPT
jgi:hypothetical protein